MTGQRNRPRGTNSGAAQAAWTATPIVADAGPIFLDHTHEPSAWLRGVIAARLAEADALRLDHDEVALAPLSGVSTKAGTREDRSCDRCHVYVAPDRADLWILYVMPRRNVLLVGGLCASCCNREVVR